VADHAVTDRERVTSCQQLWRSRFGVPPSLVEIMRVTGLDQQRVVDALCAPDPEVVKPIRRSPAGHDNGDGTETLSCRACGRRWTRPLMRGSKPTRCPRCA
jgi:hypothetical protein